VSSGPRRRRRSRKNSCATISLSSGTRCPPEIVQKSFPHTGHLLEPGPVPRIRDGEVQKLQCPLQGQSAVIMVALIPPIEGPLDFTADIGQLLHEGEVPPPPGRQRGMRRTRHFTSPSTTLSIFSRVTGSSTPRDLFP
jgi:hypothetical protein